MATFKDLTLKDLLLTSEFFGVTVEFPEEIKSDAKRKQFIITELVESGVTYEQYQEAFEREETVTDADGSDLTRPTEGNKRVDPDSAVLIKMERENGTYEIRDYRFTKTHPFAIVSEEDANFIVANVDGFRIATPAEAKEYYS